MNLMNWSSRITLSAFKQDNSGMILRWPTMSDEEAERRVQPVVDAFGEWDDVCVAINNDSDEIGVWMMLLNTSVVVENPSILDAVKQLVDVFYTYEEVIG